MKQWVCVLCMLAAGVSTFARTVEVTVTDRDLDLPLEGVLLEHRGGEPAYTDSDGRAVIELAQERVLLQSSLPGYDTRRVWVSADQASVVIKLSLEGVILGRELVVEAPQITREQDETGVSRTVDRRTIDTAARQGTIEDVMSSIKLLPGVGYAGGWNALPSVRGGHPLEMSSSLDGIYIRTPYQWGGAFSIFTPQMVESATLNHGIFSTRYGQAMSGLLEVHSRDALVDGLQYESAVATSTADFFVQAPLGQRAGFHLGGKITYLEATFAAVGADEAFTDVPYIRNTFGRVQWHPGERIHSSLTFFAGFDGVGMDFSQEPDGDDDLGSDFTFDWSALNSLAVFNLRLLPRDHLALRISTGWNHYRDEVSVYQRIYGTQQYSPGFFDEYAALLDGAESVELDLVPIQGIAAQQYTILQLRSEGDYQWGRNHLATAGFETTLELHGNSEDFLIYMDEKTESGFVYRQARSQLSTDGNRILNSGVFLENTLSLPAGRGEYRAGLRLDHSLLAGDGFRVDTRPVLNPRMNLRYRLRGDEESSLYAVVGAGLFSRTPLLSAFVQEDFRIADLAPERNLTNLAGLEWNPAADWRISLEGYYKYQFNRLYYHVDFGGDEAEPDISTDGIGHVLGTDVMLHRHQGRYWDGYLSYTFTWARQLNPNDDAGDTVWFPGGAPAGRWYYPDYHRFHNLNLILAWRPTPGISVNSRFSYASGEPRRRPGEVIRYPAVLPGQNGGDDVVLERYARSDSYSDSLRTDFSIPLDLRISFSNYYTNSRVQWEYYMAVENLLVLLYSPKTNTQFDPFSGEDIAGSDEADFSIGMPIPSFGFRVSY
ncbi:TonB-dependent receptor plug domain-containing protein [Spirochaeta africana]|uniref:Outer membrane receptor protein n=1 Tax=Spirochaeta africana (strain ATCC 700263 / DSM 8902 / Z-7692) TaxID=889378 RepID=H9ULI1_SPIAZ|nr:TonB-dependent receptor plug domain-containing protein [Spirochaeta africana]AFG38374.1 outer membrane receptor protein [Spirochaeta africana DSM 8902]